MTADQTEAIRSIYLRAIEAVTPRTVIHASVWRAGSMLQFGDREFDLARQPLYALAIGKAAGEMMAQFESIAGNHIVDSITVTKELNADLEIRARVLLGSHPVPDEKSLAAGAEMLRFAENVPEGALVVCMISGGGSALVESLRADVGLDDLRSITQRLLRAGASIHDLNAVRARLSNIKAGGLLAALRHTNIVNLIISDVLGDDLATIASGPTVPSGSSEPAEDVLRRFGIDVDLPDVQRQYSGAQPYTLVIGNLSLAIDAAADAARSMGYSPVVLARSLTGEARHVATTIASIVADSASGSTIFSPGACFIAGGETTVTVRGEGRGGRNTESALAAAIRLSGVPGVAIGFLASDGDDAETGVAGGIVDGATVDDDNRHSALSALNDNDSFTFLNDARATWGPGPTGTNVNDLVIGIVS